MFLKTNTSKQCTILKIFALRLLTDSAKLQSFRTYLQHMKLPSLLYTSQVYLFSHSSKSFRFLELKGVASVVHCVHCVKCVPLPVTCIKQDKPPPPPLCSAHSPPPHPNTSLSAEIHRFNPAEIIQNCLRFIRIIIWQKEVGITIMIAKKFLLESCEHSVIVLLSCDETLLQSVFIFQLPS